MNDAQRTLIEQKLNEFDDKYELYIDLRNDNSLLIDGYLYFSTLQPMIDLLTEIKNEITK